MGELIDELIDEFLGESIDEARDEPVDEFEDELVGAIVWLSIGGADRCLCKAYPVPQIVSCQSIIARHRSMGSGNGARMLDRNWFVQKTGRVWLKGQHSANRWTV
jgi:hypothetical protein